MGVAQGREAPIQVSVGVDESWASVPRKRNENNGLEKDQEEKRIPYP